MKSQTETIIVNPVFRIATQGRDKQSFHVIDPKTGEAIPTQAMNKTKEFGAATELSFQYNATTGKLHTGLDTSVPNPFYKLEPEDVASKYALSFEWREKLPSIVDKPNIKKQTLFEIYDNVSPNFYTSDVAGNATIFNLSKFTKIPEKPNFLQTFKVILYDRPNPFSDDTPRGRLAIQLLKMNTKVAKNKQSANNSVHLFYISELHEAELEKSRKQDIIDAAIWEKVNLQRNGSELRNYQIACLLTTHAGRPIIKGDASREAVKNALNDYLSNGDHQMENIDKFMNIIELLNGGKESREKLDIMYLVQQAINTGVIVVKDGYYIWRSKKGVPNMEKHINYDKFVSMLQTESKVWNPEDKSVTNWFGDLYEEVKEKGIWLE